MRKREAQERRAWEMVRDAHPQAVKLRDIAEELGLGLRAAANRCDVWDELSLLVGVRVGNMVGRLIMEDWEVEWVGEEDDDGNAR